jgi:hypothetical protein
MGGKTGDLTPDACTLAGEDRYLALVATFIADHLTNRTGCTGTGNYSIETSVICVHKILLLELVF